MLAGLLAAPTHVKDCQGSSAALAFANGGGTFFEKSACGSAGAYETSEESGK